MKKKIVVLVLSLGMILSMTACGDESSSNVGNGRESTSNSGAMDEEIKSEENDENSNTANSVNDESSDVSPIDTFKYSERADGTVELTGYTAKEEYKIIEIPEEIDGYSVSAIGMVEEGWDNEIGMQMVTQDDIVEKVIIPGSVKVIGGYSFLNCENLKEVVIEEGVEKIGTYAFSGCDSLEKISIPDGVETIEAGAFSTCNNLKEAYVPASVTTIGTYGVFDTYSEDLVIYGEAGSAIETYANEHGLTFVAQ